MYNMNSNLLIFKILREILPFSRPCNRKYTICHYVLRSHNFQQQRTYKKFQLKENNELFFLAKMYEKEIFPTINDHLFLACDSLQLQAGYILKPNVTCC